MYRRGIVYRPTTWNYMLTLILMTLMISVIALSSLQIFTEALMIPPQLALAALYMSLIGSMINIPLTSVKTIDYGLIYREIEIFGIRWFLPTIGLKERKTIIAINIGGAVIPILISIYILIQTIMKMSINPQISLMKIVLSILIVSIIVNRYSRIIPGFGIVTPGFIPPVSAAITSIILALIPPKCNPSIIAYISGTFGTLIGADLMNIGKIGEMGAPMVSIGGAGTFDGIYLTGIVATSLTLILI